MISCPLLGYRELWQFFFLGGKKEVGEKEKHRKCGRFQASKNTFLSMKTINLFLSTSHTQPKNNNTVLVQLRHPLWSCSTAFSLCIRSKSTIAKWFVSRVSFWLPKLRKNLFGLKTWWMPLCRTERFTASLPFQKRWVDFLLAPQHKLVHFLSLLPLYVLSIDVKEWRDI